MIFFIYLELSHLRPEVYNNFIINQLEIDCVWLAFGGTSISQFLNNFQQDFL